MASFGWIAGVHYSPHISDKDFAAFSCLLGMPWVSLTDHYDPWAVPEIPQQDCASGFGEWLTPWINAKVEWQLMAPDDDGVWATVGAHRDIVPTLDAAKTERLRVRARERLDRHVLGHGNAMGFVEGGPSGKSYTYPIMSPGLSQLPAPLSDSLLGTTSAQQAKRGDIAGRLVAAVPVFHVDGHRVAPTGTAVQLPGPVGEPPQFEFEYDGPVKTVRGVDYKFSACVVESVPSDVHKVEFPPVAPAPVLVRSRVPDRQLYAEVSRRFWPMKLWLDATGVGNGQATGFCKTFVRLLGCGEDELVQKVAVGSVYEFILDHASYTSLFPARKQEDRPDNANKILLAFEAKLAQPDFPHVVLSAFAQHLDELDLNGEKDAATTLAARSTAADSAISQTDLIAARRLVDEMGRPGRSAHPIWTAWLAAVLPHVALGGNPAEVVQRLVRSAKTALAKQDSITDPVLDDDVLRAMNGQIDYCDPFWAALHREEDIAAELGRQQAAFLADIRPRLANQAQIDLNPGYQAGLAAIAKLLEPNTPLAEDPPLQLRYAPPHANSEQAIRGCILALRAGAPQADGTVSWKPGEWITTFNAKPAIDGGFGAPMIDAGAGVSLFLDTQGATRSDGLVEQVSSYAGTPLFAAPPAPARENEESLPEMFERIPTPREVPPLAYSAYYRAVRGTLDNAGVILESELWKQPSMGSDVLPGLPRDASDIADAHWGVDDFQYLSRQPPGLPTFGPSEDHGVAQDTLSFRSHGDSSDFRVAVLYGGKGYANSRLEQQVRLYAPTASPGFVHRWLSADLLVPNEHRWPAVAALTVDQIKSLRQSGSAVVKSNAGMNAIPHPGVVAVELRVRWLSASGLDHSPARTEVWTLQHLSGINWQRNLFATVSFQRVERADPPTFGPIAGGYLVKVPAGTRAIVDAITLVSGGSIDGQFARFEKEALVNDPHPNRPYESDGFNYRSLRATRLYVESLPDAPAEGSFNFRASEFSIASPGTIAQPQELSLKLTEPGHSAHWVRGAKLESKRWQWSGYPVTFPRDDDLKNWLSLYSGTTDAMPALDDASFTTALKTQAGGGYSWLLETLVMVPLKLVTPRPATHMGMVVTPIPRFEQLLSKELKASIKPSFVYARVSGVSARKRMAPPVWLEAIPLPHTSILEKGTKRQVNPGNLIVLSDPLYDTSDTGAFGGIAERIELDVVSTWQEGLEEIGPNPIFHGSPWKETPKGSGNWTMAPQAELRMEMPFGLGYDRVVGGRPAQTGAVVRPDGAAGRWLLAKCRMRRLVVPDLILDSEVGDKEGLLEPRRVEDGWIPEDFAVYTKSTLSSISIGAYQVKLPSAITAPGEEERLIYLVSWHRDRWGEAEITWRPLVHVYLRGAGLDAWVLKRHKAPYQQDKYPLAQGGGVALPFVLSHDAVTYRVDASDYTDSRWLSFIGSFDQETVTPADRFALKRIGEVYELSSSDPMPRLRSANDLCPSLLLVFNPQRDLMRGRIAQDGGELVGVYAASTVGAERVSFDKAILKAEAPAPESGIRQRAVVMKLQRRNTGLAETLPDTWVDMVDAMFPREERLQDSSRSAGERSNEARMRLVPEYIGPIDVSD